MQSPHSDQMFTPFEGGWPFHFWPDQVIRHEVGKLPKFFLYFSITSDVDLPRNNSDFKQSTL